MPTYEYRCPDGHAFELFQKMSEPPRASCPTCGAESERLLSAGAGFLFRGGGFYITDTRTASYKEAAKADQSGGGSGASGGDSTSPPKAGGGSQGASPSPSPTSTT